jgi:hypothetical protein
MDIKKPERPPQSSQVKGKKPAENKGLSGPQSLPDVFEKAELRSFLDQNQTPRRPEPEPQAGQFTAGVLIKQMTAARLGDRGVKATFANSASLVMPEREKRAYHLKSAITSIAQSFLDSPEVKSKLSTEKQAELSKGFQDFKKAEASVLEEWLNWAEAQLGDSLGSPGTDDNLIDLIAAAAKDAFGPKTIKKPATVDGEEGVPMAAIDTIQSTLTQLFAAARETLGT